MNHVFHAQKIAKNAQVWQLVLAAVGDLPFYPMENALAVWSAVPNAIP